LAVRVLDFAFSSFPDDDHDDSDLKFYTTPILLDSLFASLTALQHLDLQIGSSGGDNLAFGMLFSRLAATKVSSPFVRLKSLRLQMFDQCLGEYPTAMTVFSPLFEQAKCLTVLILSITGDYRTLGSNLWGLESQLETLHLQGFSDSLPAFLQEGLRGQIRLQHLLWDPNPNGTHSPLVNSKHLRSD